VTEDARREPEFAGKVAVVTGGGAGIGFAIDRRSRWTASESERPPEAACKSEQQQSPISQVLASRFQSA
jgi:hypothetical protein